MIAPERRTRTDFLVTAVIVVAAAVAALGAWSFSSARTAHSEVAGATAPTPDPLLELPAGLRPAWRAHTTLPPLTGTSTVVYGDGAAVIGADPATGRQVWRYSRNERLCALAKNAGDILAFYPDARGCGEVTALDAGSGERRYARSSRADPAVTVVTDGTYAVSSGPSRVDSFRSDLVLTTEYGRPDTAVNPGTQPRWGCTQLSALPADTQIVALESCPGENSPRLTRMAATSKEATEPEVAHSTIVPAFGDDNRARLIAASPAGAAVFVPAQHGAPARVVSVDSKAELQSSTDVPAGPDGAPPQVPVTADAGVAALYTGSATVVVDTASLRVSLIIPGAVGPGVLIGGDLVVPGRTSLSSYRLDSGQLIRSTPVQRDGYTGGPVEMAVLGGTILTRWNDTLQAYVAD